MTEDNPFFQIKSRSLFFWFFLSIPIVFIVSSLLGIIFLYFYKVSLANSIFADPLFSLIFFQGWIYGLIIFWIWRQKKRSHLNFQRLIGNFSYNRQALYLLIIVFPILLFSFGWGQLTYYVLSYINPPLVQSLLEQDLFLTASDTAFPLLYNLIQFVTIVILAPVIEEILFRGLIFQRWATKWNLTKAIIISSLFFGFLHLNIVALCVFGMVMSLLYLKTRTLIIPIAAHVFNNFAAIALEFISSFIGNQETIPTLEQIRSSWWMGIGYIAISAPCLIYFFYKNWPGKQQLIPYIANEKKKKKISESLPR